MATEVEVQERRSFERREVRCPVEITSTVDPSRPLRAVTRNLTPSGLYAVTDDDTSVLTIGMKVTIRVRVYLASPSREAEALDFDESCIDCHKLSGTVMRIDPLPDEDQGSLGIALRFNDHCPQFG